MTGAPTALSTAGLATGVAAPGGGPPAVAGCGYGAVEAWAPLADPFNRGGRIGERKSRDVVR